MEKRKLFLDFDQTVVASIKSFCCVYNSWYQFEPDFKKADWRKVAKWNFNDECPLLEGDPKNVEEIFGSSNFFYELEFLNENTHEVLGRLCHKYEVVLVSIGTFDNISNKSLWVKEHLPCIKECVFLVNDGCKMTKSVVDMSGGIFLDDVSSNLYSTNADVKICVGDIRPWNQDWRGVRCADWTAIEGLLLK